MLAPILPDVLVPGMRVVFCGTAPGTASARAGAYYAGAGNRFWTALHEVGLTPVLLRPTEFARLADFDLGLTDIWWLAHSCGSKTFPGRTAIRHITAKSTLFRLIMRRQDLMRPSVYPYTDGRRAAVTLRLAEEPKSRHPVRNLLVLLLILGAAFVVYKKFFGGQTPWQDADQDIEPPQPTTPDAPLEKGAVD